MKQENKKQSFSFVASLLVLAVFAMGILGVLLTGARAYQRLHRRSAESYDSRICEDYLAARFRQAAGQVTVETFGDGDAMVCKETIEGNAYVTRIYCYDGWLMELFCSETAQLGPQAGEKILPVKSLRLTQEKGLLQVRIETEQISRLLLESPVEVTP